MKKLFILIIILAGNLAAFAQNENDNGRSGKSDEIKTLMGKNNSMGGYGALSFKYSQIDGRDAFVFGARGGALMGHMVALGLEINGFFNDRHFNAITNTNTNLAGGYGGFFFEPVVMPKFPVHISFPVLIGGGGVGVMSNQDDTWNHNYKSQASEAFMVIQPGVEVELNVTRFFRFCFGACYRYTTDIHIDNPDFAVPVDVLRGISGGVTFKFGRF
jgi:hypothetical protein